MDKRYMDKTKGLPAEHNKKWYLTDYLRDRKAGILLLTATALLFLTVGSLNQLGNLVKLLYAILLSSFLIILYGVFDYIRYLKKRRSLELAGNNLQQALKILNEVNGENHHSRLEGAYEELIAGYNEALSFMDSEELRRDSERNDYYLMWAHQIKTPIAAMKLLLNDREDRFALLEELFKIEQYVEMVLHYLRLDSMASDMDLKEYDLYSLIKETIKKYSVLFINSKLSLKLEEFHAKVLTDEKWLTVVLEQIISNSIKYTPKGCISIYMEDNESKILVIEDTGIGIREEDLPRIFERGFTGYNGRMDKKSTGIGLYLSKHIVDSLAHVIRVQSKEGKGTKVYLDLGRTNMRIKD